MLDYKKAAEILKRDQPDFYQWLETEYPDGFPLFADKLAYWQKLGEEEYPEDFRILLCSKLDAFTFYAGVKFFKEKCLIPEEIKSADLVTAIELKNYQALKFACNEAFFEPHFLEKYYDYGPGRLCLQMANELCKCYGPAGYMYLAKIYGAWAESENNIQYAHKVLAAFYAARDNGWESARYGALRKYDGDINFPVTPAIQNLKNQLYVGEEESVLSLVCPPSI